jgi:hypothetical protein
VLRDKLTALGFKVVVMVQASGNPAGRRPVSRR